MADFYEIDFLDVETRSSGDAIPLRYEINGERVVHLVDGGYQATGESIVKHIQKYYETERIDHLVVTHRDADHIGGLAEVLRTMRVEMLWMHRPWLYAQRLLHKFSTYNDADRLRARLRWVYDGLAELEDIALQRRIPILDPFQGSRIGAFTVLAPSPERYLQLILDSKETPDAAPGAAALEGSPRYRSLEALLLEDRLVESRWGVERFPARACSAENEMSVVQAAKLNGHWIVLTGDAGIDALNEAADFAPAIGLQRPRVFQIPHHGSRRNLSSDLLNRWFGPVLPAPLPEGQHTFTAVVSSAKADEDHPRKTVTRAFIHRGAKVLETESRTIRVSAGDAPDRGWTGVAGATYPTAQEN